MARSTPRPGEVDKSDFFEGAQKTTEVDGTSYGVPWYVETRLVYYRTDLAEKAGITTPPTDWDGLKTMAKAMQDKAGAKYGIGLQAGGTGSWQSVMPFAWSAGADLTKDDGKAYTFDSPEMLEALEYYQSFFNDGISDKAAPATPTTEPDFASGKVPMFISGPWMMSAVENAGGGEVQGQVRRLPDPGRQDRPRRSSAARNLVVFKNTKNRDSSWKFVQWLTDPKTQVKWYGMSTDLPSVKSAWQDPALTADTKLRHLRQAARDRPGPAVVPDVGAGRRLVRQRDREGHQVRRRPGRLAEDRAEAGRRPSAPGSDHVHRHRARRRHRRRRSARHRRAGPPSRTRRHSGRRREGWAAWILALPFCLLFLVFTLWPVAQSLFMSFTDTKAKDLRTPFAVEFVGLDNYTRASPTRPSAMRIRNTAYFVLLGVPLTMALALAAAVALDRGITKFRSALPAGLLPPGRDQHRRGRRGLAVPAPGRRRPVQHRPRLGRHRRPELAR